MARIRTVDFLPEIFKTDVNREFLGATLDQLVQEPELKKIQGYVGRRFGPGTRYNDSYVLEDTAIRDTYQLEPGVAFSDDNGNVTDAITYPGIVDALSQAGANVTRHDRLFENETYSWNPQFDFDKFINYSQYYWLPNGPDSVDVSAQSISLTEDYTVVDSDESRYEFSDVEGENPTLTLVRGGSYTFTVLGSSEFWIQAEAGVDGTWNHSPNISTRNIYGVRGNGASLGSTLTFNVPVANAQDYYYNLTDLGTVDLATTERFDSINHIHVSEFAGIDGVTDLEGKTLVFLGNRDDGWSRVGQFDSSDEYDTVEFEPTEYLTTDEERYSIFRVEYVRPVGSSDDGMYIRLQRVQEVPAESKFKITYGAVYSNRSFFKQTNTFEEVPLLTAAADYLYYQDGSTANKFGVIKLVDQADDVSIEINDIIGSSEYLSPNGVQFTNGLKVRFDGNINPASYVDNEYYVEGVGSAITLTPVETLTTVGEFYNNLNGHNGSPQSTDYLTIKRDSGDQNAWSRSNRWFHRAVVEKTAEYNNTTPSFDNDFRAKRPIIEFDSNLKLFNFGTLAVAPISVIDFNTLDALSLVHGSSGYYVDGHQLTTGDRVVFANDTDPLVQNRIYTVELVDPDDDSTEYGTIINLQLADDAEILQDMVLSCTRGDTQNGQQYRYTANNTWQLCQEKTGVNQAPLFDIFDKDGNSFGDQSAYPSTSFVGSKLFSYKEGTTVQPDQYLGFSLSYENIDNIGDIVFESNFDTDAFNYVKDLNSATLAVNNGYTRTYSTRTDYNSQRGWTRSVDPSLQRQVFTFQYTGNDLVLDVSARTDLTVPSVKVYVENEFVSASTYSTTIANSQTLIRFNSTSSIKANNIVQVKVISNTASAAAYYEVPTNLQSNAFNQSKNTFTLGNIRGHYNSLVQNINEFVGTVNGSNNSRDVGNLPAYGDVIVENSASLAAAGFFLRNNSVDFFDALSMASSDYEKFKAQLLNWAVTNDTYGMSAAEVLDAALRDINQGKTDSSKYYWEDMIPFGGDYVETNNEVTVISGRIYETQEVYDFTQSGSTGLLVYHNGVLLLKDTDYVVATDGPRIELTFDPTVGDTIVIREYATTYGSFVPPTPSKLGLYPNKDPEVYTDHTYVNPQTVVQGHDGSITIGFNDVRDDVLLEFERRIYNNLKLDGNQLPIDPVDIVPGEFRETDYTLTEVNAILAEQFLEWTGWNKIDYKTQDYRKDNEWTYNYSTASCSLDGSLLPGHWRGIYRKYYDTDHPHLHPWEMLGIADAPDWWETEYGPAPYTSGNLILWEDLEAGYNRYTETYDERYARPGLTSIIPVDSEGNLKSPMQTLVANYTQVDLRKSWNFGDEGPAEAAWRRSSSYPFAMQKLYALTKPAKYFGLMIDRDLYKYNSSVDQYVYQDRFGYNFRQTNVADVNNIKHSYINWIVEAYRNRGIETMDALNAAIAGTDVRLMYRVGGFTDKKYLRIFTDKSSPDSTNKSLILPDESYSILLYKNQPSVDVRYSGVIVQAVSGGYAVYGHSTTEPYFRIQRSVNNNNATKFEFDGTQYYLPKTFSDVVVRVPYGTTFYSKTALLDFLISYGEYLRRQGMVFEDRDNNYTLDWGLMCNEFLNWAGQGWDDGCVINLNPSANNLQFRRQLTVVDDITQNQFNDQPLDSQGQAMMPKDYKVTRIGNAFNLKSQNGRVLSYLRMRGVSYEHLIVLDNVSIFNDLIFDSVTGLRQHRVRVDGYKTANWNGQLNARGFIVNQDSVREWTPNTIYNQHDLVSYKNSLWTAINKISPSAEFNYANWEKFDSSLLTTGLMSNPANRADQMRDYYNNRVANLESDADLLGLGLTGFRSRDYLTALNLDDISQVQLYSNLIRNKGTTPTSEQFKDVELDRLSADYSVLENWAVKRATYGANNNKRYVELALDNQKLRSNPATIGIGQGPVGTPDPLQPEKADQHIDVNNIYKQAVKNTDKNIFPLLAETITDTSLPTAGYINQTDADIAIFDLNDTAAITEKLDLVQERTTVWVARKNPYDWDVYRCTKIQPTQLTAVDNLNGSIELQFDGAHSLSRGQLFVIKQSDTNIQGAHRVVEVNDYQTVTVAGGLPKETPTIENQKANVFKLISARVAYPSKLVDAEYVNSIYPGDLVWADTASDNKWRVYEKQTPFVANRGQTPVGATSNQNYGSSSTLNSQYLLVGASNYSTTGGIYIYTKENNNFKYVEVENGFAGAVELGYSLDSNDNWVVSGAPGSEGNEGYVAVLKRTNQGYANYQILVHPDAALDNPGSRLGTAVATSSDENWIYATAPGIGQVHCYQKVNYQDQRARFIADGNVNQYDLDGIVKVDTKHQIEVTVNGTLLDTTEYNLTSDVLSINDSPAEGDVIVVERISSITRDDLIELSSTEFSGIEKLYTATDIEAFAVYVDGVLQRPYYDYSYADDSSGTLNFANALGADAEIVIRAEDYYRYTNTISNTTDADFGSSIAATSDGQQIYVGAPTAGKTFVYERLVERTVVTDTNLRIYQSNRMLEDYGIVMLNGTRLLNGLESVGITYAIDEATDQVTFSNDQELKLADYVDIHTNVYNLVQTFELADANFGYSVDVCPTDCSVYIGSPSDSRQVTQAGSVARYVNGSRVFGTTTGSVANPSLTPTDTIRIDNIEVEITGTTVEQARDDINATVIPNVVASVTDGKLTISIVNFNEAPYLSKMTVMPGTGTAFSDLGFAPFVQTQTITAPTEYENAQFGSAVHIDRMSTQLIVGAVTGTTQLPVTLDNRSTVLDSSATHILDEIERSGAVYTYDLLPSDNLTVPGQFVFGQQIYDSSVAEDNQFGKSIAYLDGDLVVTSPGYSTAVDNIGRIAVFNSNNEPAWKMIRQEVDVVDSRKIYRCYIYDQDTQTVDTYVDFIDPVNGKLLGVVKDNLDFITPIDPAAYSGSNGVVWGRAQTGQLWWDTSYARFTDYNQNDIAYSARVWGSTVDGSSVDVYEWIESDVPPSQYTLGAVYNTNDFSTVSSVNAQRTISTKYYFWAKTNVVNQFAGKSLSADVIASYIANPQASGIPYIALMRRNVVGLFNCDSYLRDNKASILHIEYNQTLTDNNVFVEVDLVRANDPNSFMSDQIWRKMKDSLCGSDTLGNLVPDFNLTLSDKYGVDFRPRQSMFKDRFAALSSFLTDANTLLASQPFAELRTFNLLNAEEPIPLGGSGAWDRQVADLTELGYQTPATDGQGHRYLVTSDENNNGLWTIYTVQPDYSLLLTRVQSYDTKKFWNFRNWYATGYSNLTKPARIVNTYSELLTLTEDNDTVVKVSTNSDNKWELYVYNSSDDQWSRVGLENGTVELRSALWDYSVDANGFDREVFDVQYFDQEPIIELRNVLEALAFEILIGDFLDFRNALMISAFDYILHEQGKVDWLYKTSLIDVSHKVRNLDQYAVYQKDNQDFVRSYVEETKPYHVKIKDFKTRYEGLDILEGNVLDYDVPSSYDSEYEQFVSPILDDGIAILETSNSNRKDYDDDTVNQAASDVWTTKPWSDWYAKHKLTIDQVIVTDGGQDYTVPPVVTFTGECDTPATGTVTINEDGEVTAITLTNPGAGYRTTPVIEFSGGNGTGAVAVAYTKQDVVRTINTAIKYDRYEYTTQVVEWEANTVYDTNQLVRYNNRVYRATQADGSTPSDETFDPLVHELVSAETLSGIDRTSGFYVADVNNPGLDLALLINGLDYPMIQLKGPGFEYNTGFDVGAFDLAVFDNIETDPSGNPTYSASILDNEIFTSFTGTYTGVDLSGIEAVRATAISAVDETSLEVTEVTPIELGKGYAADVPPPVTIAAPKDNLNASATALVAGGEVSSITVDAPGFGYLSVPTVTVVEQPPTSGMSAEGTATLSGGGVDQVILSASGSGYMSAPSVTFSDPLSVQTARAAATVTLTAGAVTGYSITNGGNSYTSAPSIAVTAPPASVNAEGEIGLTAATYQVLPTGTVTVAGNYYSVAPTVTVDAPTATAVQATASATILGGTVDDISVDNPGHMYQSAPTVTITPASPTPGINAAATASLDPNLVGFDNDDGFDAVAFEAEGGVGTITVTIQGSGYTSAPTVTISAPDILGGIQATATATVSGDSAPLYNGDGYVVSIAVTEPGSGYTSAPTVTISSPDSLINHGTGATATATISDTDVIDITVTDGGEYYDIAPTITLDAPTTPYTATVVATVADGQVSALTATDQGWGYETPPTLAIAAPDVTPVTAAFTAVLTGDAVTSLTIDNSGAGYLTSPTLTIDADPSVANNVATGTAVMSGDSVASVTIDNPGATYVNPPTVTFTTPSGLTYHGSGATATAAIDATGVASITVDNPGTGYDLAPDIIISAPTRNTRQATAEAVVTGGSVTGYTITDPGYGYISAPRVTVGIPSDVDPDADIVGGSFIDVYNSHAPEELVPGAIFDTLDLRVYTRSGFDYTGNGHGFEVKSVVHTYKTGTSVYSWDNLIRYPAAILVYNSTNGTRMYEENNYLVNWVDKTITISNSVLNDQEIKIFVYSVGGGNHLYKDAIVGDQLVSNIWTVNVSFDDIESMLIQVNGEEVTGYSYVEGEFASQTKITFTGNYTSEDYISMIAFADNPAEDGSTLVDLGPSIPEVELFEYSRCELENADLRHSGRENLIVEHNGLRLRPPAGRRHAGDGSSGTYELPNGDRTGIDVSQVGSDVLSVYVNGIRQTYGVNWELDPVDTTSRRTITFLTEYPGPDDLVDIYIRTFDDPDGSNPIAEYYLRDLVGEADNVLSIFGEAVTVVPGDVVAVTSFGDTREQMPLTEVFQGPITVDEADRELFDQYNFDVDAWDRVTGLVVSLNHFELSTTVENTERMWVTLNGRRLIPSLDYVLTNNGTQMVVAGSPISNEDVVVVTSFTNSVVPDELNFRVFKDMRDNTGVYRIQNNVGATKLTQTLSWYDDTIYVEDAGLLGEPNLDAAIFGIVVINGERITYRERDTENNTLSGLRRGTAGTGVPGVHLVDTVVTDLGAGEALQTSYDQSWYNTGDTTATDGTALQQTDSVAANFFRGE